MAARCSADAMVTVCGFKLREVSDVHRVGMDMGSV